MTKGILKRIQFHSVWGTYVPPKQLFITKDLEDLKTYLDHHQIQKCTLLGHSMGGKTAMQFALTYPDLISKLIIGTDTPSIVSDTVGNTLSNAIPKSNTFGCSSEKDPPDTLTV